MPDLPASPFAAFDPRPAVRPQPARGATLHDAVPQDAAPLGALQAQVRGGDAGRWEGKIAALIQEPRGTVVVARAEGSLLGFANAEYLPAHPDDGAPAGYYLTGVTVAPQWRRRGLGRLLTRRRMEWAWWHAPDARGEVWCFVSSANPASLALHHALGFVAVRSGPAFQGIPFTSGDGTLLRARPKPAENDDSRLAQPG
ncbi:GNAT family N-acetyltransferase [Streptomyces sp. NPDC051940]|uniref:GNAT family N-acetyltransferase n=1 Tax=Streptomyces sp. NPDC051940 TaxID=3155675 RepID=UPI00341E2F00